MRCFVINLVNQPERRAAVEASFAAASHDGWELVVVPAIGAAEAASFGGMTTPAEKGCFLSHRQIIESSIGDDEPIWIVEDDVMFSRDCFEIVTDALRHIPTADVLFTDIAGAGPQDPITLLTASPPPGSGRFVLLDLKSLMFAGTTSYVVNGRSKEKLAKLLGRMESLPRAYDMTLLDLVRSGEISTAVTLPFVTSLSGHADVSQIRDGRGSIREGVWNAMRRLLYIDADIEACRLAADHIDQALTDERARIMGRLVGARIAADFAR